MLDIFKRLKVDEWHPNPEDWAPYVLDDVYYFTSAAALSKADRVNRLAQQRQSGVPGAGPFEPGAGAAWGPSREVVRFI